MTLTREAFLAATEFPRELVDIPALGGAVYVRVMSAAEKDRMDGEQVAAKGTQRFEHFRSRLVVACACDEAGRPLFTRDDLPVLSALPVSVLEPIVEAAIRINRLGPGELDALRKNSEATPAAASNGAPH